MAKYMEASALYPEARYKAQEARLSQAEQKIVWWERQVKGLFAKDHKIHQLQASNSRLKLQLKDVQGVADLRKIHDKHLIDDRDGIIKSLRGLLEQDLQDAGAKR